MAARIKWTDLRFMAMSKMGKDRRFFRIDREVSTKLNPTWSLTWVHQPSKVRNSKQHWIKHERGIRTKADAMALADQWQAEDSSTANTKETSA